MGFIMGRLILFTFRALHGTRAIWLLKLILT